MNAPTIQTHGETRKAHQEPSELREGKDAKVEMGTAKVWISEAIGTSVGARVLRVVTLGVLLAGAAALYSSISQGEAGSPSAQVFEVAELEAPSIGVPAYLSREAAVDFAVEELEAPVIGVPAYLSRERTQAVEVEQREQDDLMRDRIELIEELGERGVPWQIDDQGRIAFGVAPTSGK